MKWLTLASLVLLAGCSHEPSKLRIAVGGQTQLVYLPTTLADRLGYYKDEGLDVELQDFQGGAKSLEDVKALFHAGCGRLALIQPKPVLDAWRSEVAERAKAESVSEVLVDRSESVRGDHGNSTGS